MNEFNNCAEQYTKINEYTSSIEKLTIFSTLHQTNSCLEGVISCIQNFDGFTNENAKLITLKNLMYWIFNHWELLTSNLEVINLIRDFLFQQNFIKFDSFSQEIQEANARTQAAFAIRVYPENWENIYRESIFSGSAMPQVLLFITELSNILANPQPSLKDFLIYHRDLLIHNKISQIFQQYILDGISASIPQAFFALGNYSMAFDNSWISDANIFGQVGTGMSSPKTAVQTLECIRLMLMSNFTVEQKIQIVVSLNLCEVVIGNDPDPNIMVQYSKIIYFLSMIYLKDEASYPRLIEAALRHLLSPSEQDVIYSCQTLNSALTKKPEQFVQFVCHFALRRLYEYNKTNKYITPPLLARSLINLIEKCAQYQTNLTILGFSAFMEESMNNPLEDLSLGTTILQFIRKYRTFIQQRSAEDETDEISQQFNVLAEVPESINEEQISIYAAFFDLVMSYPKEPTESFQAALSFITNEQIPQNLTNYIIKLMKEFIFKKHKIDIESIGGTMLIEQFLTSGNSDLVIIAGKLINLFPENTEEMTITGIQALVSLISHAEDPRASIINVLFFIAAVGKALTNPENISVVDQFISDTISTFPEDDYVIGNIAAVLPYLNTQTGISLLESFLSSGGGMWWLTGVCRALGVFTWRAMQNQSPQQLKQIFTNPEWQSQAFSSIMSAASNLFQQIISADYHFCNTEEIGQAFGSLFFCMNYLHRFLPREMFMYFIEFVAQFCVTLYDVNIIFDKVYSFVNNLVADKSIKFDTFGPWQILPQLHSFLFNPDFDINKDGTVIAKHYFSMMNNMLGRFYQYGTQAISEIFRPFQLDSNFVTQFIGDLEGQIHYAIPRLHSHLEIIVLYKSFIIHTV